MNDLELVLMHKLSKACGAIILEVPIESGGYSGTGVNNEGKVIGVDNTARLISIRCRSVDMPFLPAGTYEVSPSPTADNDISFALTLAALTTDSPDDITDYVLKNAMGGGWNAPGAVTITVSAPAYLAITVKKESDASITPAAAGSYVIIQKV